MRAIPSWIEVSTAERAIRSLRRAELIYLESGAGEPQTLVRELVRSRAQLTGVEVATAPVSNLNACAFAVGPGPGPRLRSLLYSAEMSDEYKSGRATYVPLNQSQAPAFIRNLPRRLDAALIHVSPPDEAGRCSLGTCVDIIPQAIAKADIVIAEMNPEMPRTLGSYTVPASALDVIVPGEHPPLCYRLPEVGTDVSTRIAEHVASVIPDAATVQVGIGRLADHVWAALAEHRELGVHSGMLTDGFAEAVRAGAVTGSHKSFDIGLSIASQYVGTERLWQLIDSSDSVRAEPTTYTHSLKTLSAIQNFHAVNFAIEVDLQGQVNSEWVGGQRISGVGGLNDFVRGARLAEGGRSIIALASTAHGKTGGRIVARLDSPGATVHAADADIVITEYGVAELRDRDVRERARTLIAIAHPDFRAQLSFEAGL